MAEGPEFGAFLRSAEPPISVHDKKILVETGTGAARWVTITIADTNRIMGMIPKGWAPVVKAREAGMTMAQLLDRFAVGKGLTSEQFRDGLWCAYGWVSQQERRLAEHRAGVDLIAHDRSNALRRQAVTREAAERSSGAYWGPSTYNLDER